jgi:hypothetical protein
MKMSNNNELLRKILKHPDLHEMIVSQKSIDNLTISEARQSDDPYVCSAGEILYQLSQNKNVNSINVYNSVLQLLKTKL